MEQNKNFLECAKKHLSLVKTVFGFYGVRREGYFTKGDNRNFNEGVSSNDSSAMLRTVYHNL